MVAITPRLIELKARIFCHGLRVADDVWREIADENHYKHKRAGLSQGRFLRLRDGLSYTLVNAPVREPFVARSPLSLGRDPGREGRYAIYDGEARVAECTPVAWPKWYSRTTSDGTPMSMVVSAHNTSLYTAIYQGGCDFFSNGQECKFCAMKIDNKLQWRKIEQIIEVVKVAQEENPAVELSFGGGTRLTPDRSAKIDAEAVRRLKQEIDIQVCVEMAPPDTDDWIDLLIDSGVNSLLFNLELWSPAARAHIMPGKSKISRERYLAAMRYAVGKLGANQVSSQVVIGLEPIEDTLAAIDAIIEAGAIPLPVVFRPLANTQLVDQPPPSVADAQHVFDQTFMRMEAHKMGHSKAGCALCGACSAHR